MLPGGWHEAQEAIDKEITARITAHKSAILELRARRNGLAPISKVPVELLEEIFVLAKLLPSPWIAHSRVDDRGWLNVARVCRNWREITLNAPRMWNRFDVSKIGRLRVDWVTASLTRSQHAPLHVKCTDSEGEIGLLSVLLAHMNRIGHLDITSNATRNRTGLSRIMEMIGTHRTPTLLQSLRLSNQTPEYNSYGIHRIFSTLQMHCLQTLKVLNFTLPPTIPILPQLRHFVYNPPREPATKLTTATILSLLRNTPSLERLEIGGHALVTSDEVIMKGMTVELAKLSFISYTIEEFTGTSLFGFIDYPPSARVEFALPVTPIRAPTRTCAAECIDELTAIVLHMGCGDDTANIDTLSLEVYRGDFNMTACIHHELVLNILVPTMMCGIFPLFRLSTMLPVYGIRTLEIGGFPSLTEEDWASFFRRHMQVQTLIAKGVNTTFIRTISKPLEAGQPPFPQLKIVELYFCDIEQVITSLEGVLKERLDLKSPIDLLKIDECKTTRNIIRQLEAYVKVEWDGCERFRYYDDDD